MCVNIFIGDRICGSYPECHIVPHGVADKDIESSSGFRSSRRFPSVVWRYCDLLLACLFLFTFQFESELTAFMFSIVMVITS